MKCIIPSCTNEISDSHNEENVAFEGIDFDVASAVISSDKQGFVCEFHEKIIIDLARLKMKAAMEAKS